MRKILAAVILAGATACGPTVLHVESDTEWDGVIGGSPDNGGPSTQSNASGSGNRIFELEKGTTCWNFRKQTEGGRLKAYAKEPSLLGSDSKGEAETVAPFGVVSGCITY